jgi:flagellar hook-length control protein FliK
VALSSNASNQVSSSPAGLVASAPGQTPAAVANPQGPAGFVAGAPGQDPAAATNPQGRDAGAMPNATNGHQASADMKSPGTTNTPAPDALAQLTGSLAQKTGSNSFSPPTLSLATPAVAPNAHAANANFTGGHGHPGQDTQPGFAANPQGASTLPQPATQQPATSAPNPAPAQNQSAQAAPSAGPGAISPAAASSSPVPATANVALTQHATEMHASQMPDIGTLAVSIAARSLAGLKQFDIRLDPPELGRVDVRLSVDESGKAQATLAADRPETLHLLKNDAPALERALKDSGLNLANNGLSFSLKGQDRQADPGGNQPRNRSFSAKAQLTIESVGPSTQTPIGLAPEGAGLDIRV